MQDNEETGTSPPGSPTHTSTPRSSHGPNLRWIDAFLSSSDSEDEKGSSTVMVIALTPEMAGDTQKTATTHKTAGSPPQTTLTPQILGGPSQNALTPQTARGPPQTSLPLRQPAVRPRVPSPLRQREVIPDQCFHSPDSWSPTADHHHPWNRFPAENVQSCSQRYQKHFC